MSFMTLSQGESNATGPKPSRLSLIGLRLIMVCKCGGEMFVSEWDGWRWVCILCDEYGPVATEEEINEQRGIYEDNRQTEGKT